jgi:hypothetical protein
MNTGDSSNNSNRNLLQFSTGGTSSWHPPGLDLACALGSTPVLESTAPLFLDVGQPRALPTPPTAFSNANSKSVSTLHVRKVSLHWMRSQLFPSVRPPLPIRRLKSLYLLILSLASKQILKSFVITTVMNFLHLSSLLKSVCFGSYLYFLLQVNKTQIKICSVRSACTATLRPWIKICSVRSLVIRLNPVYSFTFCLLKILFMHVRGAVAIISC